MGVVSVSNEYNVTSFSADDDVKTYLERDSINASGLVNDLVRMHMNGGGDSKQMREFRIQQLQSEIESLESKLENKREQLDRLMEQDEKYESKRERDLEEALGLLETVDWEVGNPAIEKQARELDMSQEELIERLEEEYDG